MSDLNSAVDTLADRVGQGEQIALQPARRIALSIALPTVVMALLLICQPATAVEIGDAAPDFELPLIANPSAAIVESSPVPAQFRLLRLSSYHGRVVYLDFWDSSCVSCREALPGLSRLRAELHDQYSPDEVEVLAVNLDPDPNQALRFLDRYPVSFPVVSDPGSAVATRYRLSTLPTAFLIARDGSVQHVHRGFRRQDLTAIRARLTSMITETNEG